MDDGVAAPAGDQVPVDRHRRHERSREGGSEASPEQAVGEARIHRTRHEQHECVVVNMSGDILLQRLPGVRVAHRLDNVSDGGDHELGLLVVDVVAAPLGDDMLAPGDE